MDSGGQQTAVKRYYAIGGQPIAVRESSGTFYLLTDHLGSVVAVLDASGAVVGEQRYRPFGQPRLTPGITQTDRGFTEQQSLAAAGLQDFRAASRSEAEGQRTMGGHVVGDVSRSTPAASGASQGARRRTA